MVAVVLVMELLCWCGRCCAVDVAVELVMVAVVLVMVAVVLVMVAVVRVM